MMDPDTSHKRPSPPYRTSIQLREQAADSQSLPEDIPASSTVDHAYGSQEILKALSHTESDGEHLQNLQATARSTRSAPGHQLDKDDSLMNTRSEDPEQFDKLDQSPVTQCTSYDSIYNSPTAPVCAARAGQRTSSVDLSRRSLLSPVNTSPCKQSQHNFSHFLSHARKGEPGSPVANCSASPSSEDSFPNRNQRHATKPSLSSSHSLLGIVRLGSPQTAQDMHQHLQACMGHLQERLEDAESTARRDRVVEKRKIDKYEDEVQYLRGELALLYRQNAELLTITAARRVPQSLTNSEVKANDLLEHEEDITAAYCLSSLGNNPGSERPAVYAWDHPRTPREQPESKSSNLPISLSSSDDLSLEPRPAFSSPSPSPSTRHLGASNVMQEDLDPEEAEADDEWGPLIHQLADLRQENETLRSRVDELEAIHDTLEQPFLDERDHAPFCRRNSSSYSSTESCVSSHLDLEFPSSTHLQTMRHQQDSQFSEPSPVDHVHLKCSMASATQSSPYVPSRPSRLSRVFDLGQSERACETDGPFNFAEESIETSAFGRSLASELGDDVSNDGSLRRLAVPSSSSAHLHLPIDWPQQGLSLSEQTFSIQSSQKDVSSASSVPSSATAVELPPSSYRPLSLQSLLGRHPGDAVGSFMPVGMPSIRSSTNVKKVQNRYLQLQSMMALVAVSAIEWSHFILLLIVAAFCCIKQGPAMLQQRQPRHEKTADSALCCS